MAYEPPLDDIRFALEHLVDLQGLTELAPFADADPDTVFGVLEEAGRFMAEVLGPLRRVGDTEPATWHDPETVTAPSGFKDPGYGRGARRGRVDPHAPGPRRAGAVRRDGLGARQWVSTR